MDIDELIASSLFLSNLKVCEYKLSEHTKQQMNSIDSSRFIFKIFRKNRKLIHFPFYCEELWKRDADTVTPIIVTKLPGSALFIQLCCTGCGADSGWTEDDRLHSSSPLISEPRVIQSRVFCFRV